MSAIVFEKSPVLPSVATTTLMLPPESEVPIVPGFVKIEIVLLDMINPFCNDVEPPRFVILPVSIVVVLITMLGSIVTVGVSTLKARLLLVRMRHHPY